MFFDDFVLWQTYLPSVEYDLTCFGLVLLVYFTFVQLIWFSPEFSFRPGLVVVSEDTSTAPPISSGHAIGGSGGPPNRPLPPTPDDDDQAGDRTLIMKRVSTICNISPFNFILIYLN